MATLLQQRAVEAVVGQYVSLYGLPNYKAFLFLVIEKYLQDLGLNSIDIQYQRRTRRVGPRIKPTVALQEGQVVRPIASGSTPSK